MVDLRWAWVQELRDKNKIGVEKVDTEMNKADILPTYSIHFVRGGMTG